MHLWMCTPCVQSVQKIMQAIFSGGMTLKALLEIPFFSNVTLREEPGEKVRTRATHTRM